MNPANPAKTSPCSLIEYGYNLGIRYERLQNQAPAIFELPFDSSRKRMFVMPSMKMIPQMISAKIPSTFPVLFRRRVSGVSGEVSCTTEESALTGETGSIEKTSEAIHAGELPIGDQKNMVFSGTMDFVCLLHFY